MRLPSSSSGNTPRMLPPLAVFQTLMAVQRPAGTSMRTMSCGSGSSTRTDCGSMAPPRPWRPMTVQTWRSSSARPVLGRQYPPQGPSTVCCHSPIAWLANCGFSATTAPCADPDG